MRKLGYAHYLYWSSTQMRDLTAAASKKLTRDLIQLVVFKETTSPVVWTSCVQIHARLIHCLHVA